MAAQALPHVPEAPYPPSDVLEAIGRVVVRFSAFEETLTREALDYLRRRIRKELPPPSATFLADACRDVATLLREAGTPALLPNIDAFEARTRTAIDRRNKLLHWPIVRTFGVQPPVPLTSELEAFAAELYRLEWACRMLVFEAFPDDP